MVYVGLGGFLEGAWIRWLWDLGGWLLVLFEVGTFAGHGCHHLPTDSFLRPRPVTPHSLLLNCMITMLIEAKISGTHLMLQFRGIWPLYLWRLIRTDIAFLAYRLCHRLEFFFVDYRRFAGATASWGVIHGHQLFYHFFFRHFFGIKQPFQQLFDT